MGTAASQWKSNVTNVKYFMTIQFDSFDNKWIFFHREHVTSVIPIMLSKKELERIIQRESIGLKHPLLLVGMQVEEEGRNLLRLCGERNIPKTMHNECYGPKHVYVVSTGLVANFTCYNCLDTQLTQLGL